MYNGCSYGSGYGSQGAAYGSSYAGMSQSYSSAEQSYSSLDSIVSHAVVERPVQSTLPHYVPSSVKGSYLSNHTPHDYFIADTFLVPGSTAPFVGDAAEIKDHIKEAFTATTGEELPKDIIISVLDNTEFKKAHVTHNGVWNEGVQGFSLNTNGRGVNQIFVRANPLDRLMLTIGHEIGHVLTQSLKNPHDEEAKAFAFSLAWMNSIREKNIAGIGGNITPDPANNGLHDVAFAFVQKLIENGTRAWEAFLQLARGTVTIREQPITVEA